MEPPVYSSLVLKVNFHGVRPKQRARFPIATDAIRPHFPIADDAATYYYTDCGAHWPKSQRGRVILTVYES